MRPSDLARTHGLSAQAVRNYEGQGILPAADRTDNGYRSYTRLHALALDTFIALIPAYGHAYARAIMRAAHDDEIDSALAYIHHGHRQALRDRETLDAVKQAVAHVSATEPTAKESAGRRPRTIGELAHRLNLTPATLRAWEASGILRPGRDPDTGFRVYRAEDVRDADLTRLLRRGGYSLRHIAGVIDQLRTLGSTRSLAGSLADWDDKLIARGLAMLAADGKLDRYLSLLRANRLSDDAHDGRVQHVGQEADQERQQSQSRHLAAPLGNQ